VGATEVAQIRTVTGQLREIGRRHGGGTALDAALGFAGWAHRMLGSRHSETVGRDLRLALGELYGLIGWTQSDVRNTAAMRRHYFQVLVLARDADEPELVADALGDLARATVEVGNAHEGLRLARIGLAMATERVSPATVARLHLSESHAWAQLGDEHGTREALARAEDALGRANLVQVPAWATTSRMLLDPGHLASMRLEIYEELSRHPEHSGYAETAVAIEPAACLDNPTHSYRSAVLTQVMLAAAQLRAGCRDEGLATSHHVLDKVATLHSARARARLSAIVDATARYPAQRDITDLRTELAAHTPS
jgi:hypothetical protein